MSKARFASGRQSENNVPMNNSLTFYDQLLKFQLFQGLSRTELLQLAGQTKFGFTKVKDGVLVVRDGDICRELWFLVKGRLQLTSQSDDHAYAFVEEVSSPWLLQPEALFGASPRFSISAQAISDAHFILLSKDEVLRLLNDFLVFRLNMLNILATQSQRRAHRLWRVAPRTLRDRIVAFLLVHSVYPAGRKTVRILMTRLAQEVNDSRLDVSRELNKMQDEQLLILRRGRIEVPLLERLLM